MATSNQTHRTLANTDIIIDNDIGLVENGCLTGDPVIYLHGLPGSRHESLIWHSTAQARNVRLIAPDRPGMGLSPSQPNRKITDYPKDIARIVQHLKLDRYYILGISGGGPYALACAAQAKDLFPGLQGVGIVAGLAPRTMMDGNMGWYQWFSYAAMDWVPTALVRWFCDTMIGRPARDPNTEVLVEKLKKGFKTLKGRDSDTYKDEELMQAIAASMKGAFAMGSEGYVTDAAILTKPWGFELGAIKDTNVTMWYGEEDEAVPIVAGRGMAENIPQAKLHVLNGETHTGCVARHQDKIFSDLLSLLSQQKD